jgi:hypothetical protein
MKLKESSFLKIIEIDNKSQSYDSEIKIEIERIIFVNFIKDNLNKLRNEINRICFW